MFDVPGDSRAGKVVIRVDYAEKARQPDGKRGMVVSNSIRTAGVVDVVTLRDPASYDVLKGEL